MSVGFRCRSPCGPTNPVVHWSRRTRCQDAWPAKRGVPARQWKSRGSRRGHDGPVDVGLRPFGQRGTGGHVLLEDEGSGHRPWQLRGEPRHRKQCRARPAIDGGVEDEAAELWPWLYLWPAENLDRGRGPTPHRSRTASEIRAFPA